MKRRIAAGLLIMLTLLVVGCSEKSGAEALRVEGLNEDEAIKRLEDAGYDVDPIYVEDNSVPEGTVIRTEPVTDPEEISETDNTKASAQTSVKLFVSSGSDTSVRVPNIIGKSLDEAKSQLSSTGLQVSSDIKYKTSDKPKGTVILCSPLPGSSVPSGSSVELTLSSGEKEKKEKTIDVKVDLPSDIPEAKLEVYVDGIMDSSMSKTVDTSFKNEVTFTFKGTQGTRDVSINLNDQLYKKYEINFDDNSLSEIDL